MKTDKIERYQPMERNKTFEHIPELVQKFSEGNVRLNLFLKLF